MKNDIIRFENNVPDNYLVGSRDYQALLRLFTFGISSIKFDVDNIRYVNDASHINSRLLNLLKLKVGFFTKEEFKDQYIREVLKVFSLIVKKKGTRQAIYDAINLYFRACRYNGDYVVEINNKDDIQPYMIRIGVTKESNDILLLEEILKYILPTGYLYEVFKYSTAKYKSNYYSQDILTLSVVDDYNGSSIHDNSSNIFIEKLFEGTSVGPAAICSFSDGIDAPLKSLKFTIEPAQDLHGYDYPWPAGGGKNLIPTTLSYLKSNNTNGSWTNDTYTISGLTFKVNDDGTLTVNGTSTAAVYFNFVRYAEGITLAAGAYLLHATGSANILVNVAKNNAYWGTANTSNAALSLDEDAVWSGYAYVSSGKTLTNFVLRPMLEMGSTASAWQPYSNICPISGWTQVNGVAAGKNILDVSSLVVFGGNQYISTPSYASVGGIDVKPNTTYTLSVDIPSTGRDSKIYGFDASGNRTQISGSWSTVATFTTPADCVSISFYCKVATTITTASEAHPILVVGSSPSTYEDPALTPITIPLGQTVYGGTLDLVGGKLVIDYGIATLDTSLITGTISTSGWYFGYTFPSPMDVNGVTSTSAFSGIASACKPAQQGINWANTTDATIGYWYAAQALRIKDGAADQSLDGYRGRYNGMQVVYKLATPIEVDLTPQTIKTLLGTNNIWADSGDTSLEYLSEKDAGKSITYYNVYNNVTDNYINILTYPSVDDIELYNGDFTVSVSETDFDLDNANMYVLVHQYLKDDRIVCGKTTWSISYDVQTDSITATSGNNEINISYSNFIRNLPLLEDHEIPSSFTLEYENESISTEGFVLQDDNRSFTFTGYSGNKIIVKYETDSQYLGKRIDNVVVYKNGWENESN